MIQSYILMSHNLCDKLSEKSLWKTHFVSYHSNMRYSFSIASFPESLAVCVTCYILFKVENLSFSLWTVVSDSGVINCFSANSKILSFRIGLRLGNLCLNLYFFRAKFADLVTYYFFNSTISLLLRHLKLKERAFSHFKPWRRDCCSLVTLNLRW